MKKVYILSRIAAIIFGFVFAAFMVSTLTSCGGSDKSSRRTTTVVETKDFSEVDLQELIPNPEDYISSGEVSIDFNEASQHYRYAFGGFTNDEEVKSYIQAVKAAGFTSINSSYELDDSILYNANTADDVYKVRISYYRNQGSLMIIFDSVEELYVE